MSKAPIALQLYVVRNDVERNLPQTLQRVADIGYQGAEPYGFDGSSDRWQNHTATEIRRMFDDNGLTCCGFHLAPAALAGDNLKRTIALNQTLGNRFLVVAGAAKQMSSLAGIDAFAGALIHAAEKLQSHGMFAGYHAHGFDFTPVEGEVPWYRLFNKLPREVIMQIDTGNCADGGGDPIDVLRKFPGRSKSVHLKDHGGAPGSVIGEGKLDWKTIFHLCDTQQPVEWYVVEQGESAAGSDAFDVPRRTLEALRKMGR